MLCYWGMGVGGWVKQLLGNKPSFPGLDLISAYCFANLASCKANPMHLGFLHVYFCSCVYQKLSHQKSARAWHQVFVRDG